MAKDFVFLRDQQPLTAQELTVARDVCRYTRRVIDERADYIEGAGLDPAVHFPQANWSLDSPIYEAYRAVVAEDPEVIEYLRLFAQMFTGYRLCELKSAAGTHPLQRVSPDLDAHLELLSRTPDLWVTRYERVANRIPKWMKLSPPAKFGEIGWVVEGSIVNMDTYVYLERLALLHEARLLGPEDPRSLSQRNPVTVLEIGGGYGGLAYYLRRLLPDARYVVVDLPESLLFSAMYLSVQFHDLGNQYLETKTDVARSFDAQPGFTFVPNYFFPRLVSAGLRPDLVINTLSMSEMSEAQIRMYCEGISSMLGTTGAFFEQNQDNRHIGLANAMDIIAEYFSNRLELTGDAVNGLTQGKAHIWRN